MLNTNQALNNALNPEITLGGHRVSTTEKFRLPASSRSLSFRENRKEGIPLDPTVQGKGRGFLLLFPRANHLCKGTMLQLEEKEERDSVSLVAPFRKIGR